MLFGESVDVIDRRPAHTRLKGYKPLLFYSYPPLAIKAKCLFWFHESLCDGDHYRDHTAYCSRLFAFQMTHVTLSQRGVEGLKVIDPMELMWRATAEAAPEVLLLKKINLRAHKMDEQIFTVGL